MQPLERRLNLLHLLLDTGTPLTFREIRERIPAYDQEDTASAKRMFERDKDALRELGVPVELDPVDVWESDEGYVIDREAYELPELSFTPEEASALVVVAASGTASTDDEDIQWALRKLLVGAGNGPLSAPVSMPAVVEEADDPRAAAVALAIQEGRSLRFGYRTVTGEASDRHLDPYGLVWRSGHAYAVGLDGDRNEIRAFRISRFATDPWDGGAGSAPPKDFRARDYVTPVRPAPGVVRVAFAPGVAWWATGQVSGTIVERTRDDGWEEATVPADVDEWLVSWVLSFGPDAEALDPPELRERIVRHLGATLAAR